MKKKVLEKRKKVAAALSEARKRKKSREKMEMENVEVNLCDERRNVELSVLDKNLRCCKWTSGEVLSSERVMKETHLKINSVCCDSYCMNCVNTRVPTGTIHTTKDNVRLSDINTKGINY